MSLFWILSWLFLGCVILVLIASYKRLPADLVDRRQARLLFAVVNICTYAGILLEYLGLGSRHLWWKRFEKTKYEKEPRTEKGVKYYDAMFDGVRVRIYEPEDTGSGMNRPAIIYFHGGGFIAVNVESYHSLTRSICRRIGVPLFAVDYRRAPEHPYPEPFDDCLRASLHCFKNAETYNIDPKRIVLMGDSAGGNLTAALCLKLRDIKSEFRPRLQVLIYPLVQVMDLQLPSYKDPYKLFVSPQAIAMCISYYAGQQNKETLKLTTSEHVYQSTKRRYADLINYLPEEFRKGYFMYTTKEDPELAEIFNQFVTDPYFAPLMADSFEDLPEAYIWTAGYDLLRDEGIMYAERLKDHGVPVTWVNKQHAMHGSWHFGFPSGRIYRKETCEFIQERLCA